MMERWQFALMVVQ